MSLKAHINTDASGNIIVHMEGGLNHETTEHLRLKLCDLSDNNPQSKLTLDLHKMDFVGSSGLNEFVDILNEIHAKRGQIKLINVRNEFKRIFKLFQLRRLEEMLDEFESESTIHLNSVWGNKKRTFEN